MIETNDPDYEARRAELNRRAAHALLGLTEQRLLLLEARPKQPSMLEGLQRMTLGATRTLLSLCGLPKGTRNQE